MAGKGLITNGERELLLRCIDKVLKYGATGVRANLGKSVEHSISVLDNVADGIQYSADKSLAVEIFLDGRYGSFITNRIGDSDFVDRFLKKAFDTASALAPDKARTLPPKEFKASGCADGDELGTADPDYFGMDDKERLNLALAASAIRYEDRKCRLISSECEYSDTFTDSLMMDSDGFEGRQIETSFGYSSKVTVQDGEGRKYESYWWNLNPFRKSFQAFGVSDEAMKLAAAKIGPLPVKPGRFNLIVDRSCSSRFAAPLLSALEGQSILQQNSFLKDSADKKIFPDILTIYDRATEKGCIGSSLFDGEGLAFNNSPIIQNGVVKRYFVNAFTANKTGWKPTVNRPCRPCIRPYICKSGKKAISLEDMLSLLGEGIYVTGINGGNCNSATGNFSFGIEGFAFKDGRTVHPISGQMLTGNMRDLWGQFVAAASDARQCCVWQIPSLAFKDIEINV